MGTLTMKSLFTMALFIAVTAAFPILAHQGSHEQKAQTQYLGNEAVLVIVEGTKIIFDPFFHNDFGIYQMVPEAIRQDIMSGKAPYDGIDLVLVSHAHADHFAAGDMLRYLKSQGNVTLVAPKQAVEELSKQAAYAEIESRVVSVSLQRGDEVWRQSIKGLEVEGVRIPHAGWPGRADVENLVFKVTFDQRKSVLHMGDADPLVDHYLPYREHWKNNPTDLGFPPYWFYHSLQGRDILDDYMNIKNTIGVHVPVTAPKWLIQQDRDFFNKPGEVRAF